MARTRITTSHELGTAIAARRRQLGLSQEALAFTIGVNRRVIGELERGKGTARIEIALAAASAVGLELLIEADADG